MANFLDLVQEGGSTSQYGAWVVDDQSWLGSATGTNSCDTITLDGPACLDAFPRTGRGRGTGLAAPAPRAG